MPLLLPDMVTVNLRCTDGTKTFFGKILQSNFPEMTLYSSDLLNRRGSSKWLYVSWDFFFPPCLWLWPSCFKMSGTCAIHTLFFFVMGASFWTWQTQADLDCRHGKGVRFATRNTPAPPPWMQMQIPQLYTALGFLSSWMCCVAFLLIKTLKFFHLELWRDQDFQLCEPTCFLTWKWKIVVLCCWSSNIQWDGVWRQSGLHEVTRVVSSSWNLCPDKRGHQRAWGRQRPFKHKAAMKTWRDPGHNA